MSMIENLENIRKIGINNFVVKEQERWRCTKCDGTINVHRGYCAKCGETSKTILSNK
jgi:transposase-like protein